MTRPVALLCSGQGGQHRDMFRLTEGEAAAAVFEAAARALDGRDPRRFVREAPDDALFANRAGQVLCCTAALALLHALGDTLARPLVVAGYSVGELAAWGCAGRLGPDAVLRLAAERAELMDRCAPANGGLLAVAGPRPDRLDRLLAASPDVELAIRNAPDSIVVGGGAAALDRFADRARDEGASTVRRLPVAVPSHTALLRPAARSFAELLGREAIGPGRAGTRLIGALDGEQVRDGREGAARLARQVGETVRWDLALEAIAASAPSRVLELGPGEALARMAARVVEGAPVRSADQFRTLDGVRSWLDAPGR